MFAKRKIQKRQIASYLTGNCSGAEKSLVEQWINASDKNAELFEQYKATWAYTDPVADMISINVNEAFEKTTTRIERHEGVTSRKVRKILKHAFPMAYRYAASVAAVLLIAFGTLFFLKTETAIQTTSFTAETKLLEPIVLSDGTKVFLNSGTTFTYPEVFSGNKRQVTLCGEAFFNVSHDPSRPFIISTGNLGVKVLGTSFNVNAANKLETVEVTIQNGRVLFYSLDTKSGDIQEQIILAKGEKGIYHKNNNLIVKSLVDNHNYLGWKTGLLEFDNTPLPEVFQSLEHAYGLVFIYERDVDHLLLTARFDREDPDNILETLRLIFGFQIERTGKQIRIF